MRIKFYLKRPGEKSPTSIYALANYSGNTIKVYTGESITPKYWNAKKNIARDTPAFPEHPEFNERLNNIRSTINRVYLDFRNRNHHSVPDPAVLKSLIEEALNRKSTKTTFISFFQDFATRTTNGARVNPRTRGGIKGTGGRGYVTTLNHLMEFEKRWKRKLSFETIDLDFYDDFTTYLAAPPLSLSLNTIGSHIQRIKAVMSEAVDKKLTTNTDFKSRRFVKLSEDADTIYLNEKEIKQLKELDLSENKTYDNVRDLFLIGYYTGLRYSDWSSVTPADIEGGFIRIKSQKVNSFVTIPVHRVIKELLKKHKGHLPEVYHNKTINEYLKEIGKKMPLLEAKVSKEITKGGTRIIKTVPKWTLLSSHTARRSFATNEYKAGTPILIIMAITGHKTEKSFLKYIRVTPEEHAQDYARILETRDKRGNLKVV